MSEDFQFTPHEIELILEWSNCADAEFGLSDEEITLRAKLEMSLQSAILQEALRLSKDDVNSVKG